MASNKETYHSSSVVKKYEQNNKHTNDRKAIEKFCNTKYYWNNIYENFDVKINKIEYMQIFEVEGICCLIIHQLYILLYTVDLSCGLFC